MSGRATPLSPAEIDPAVGAAPCWRALARQIAMNTAETQIGNVVESTTLPHDDVVDLMGED